MKKGEGWVSGAGVNVLCGNVGLDSCVYTTALKVPKRENF
jgi:hypothetical protein